MEWITWEEYIQNKGRLSLEDTMRMLEPVIAELQDMHRAGRCYGKVTPQNIMIRKRMTTCFRMTERIRRETETEWQNNRITLCRQKQRIAEPAVCYQTPEYYFERNVSPVGDIYAVCAIIYYAVTGMIPQTVIKRLRQDRIGKANFKQMMPEKMEKLLLKGMSLKRDDRFWDISELLKVRVWCQFDMGEIYYFSGNHAEAVKWYQKAAEKGHAAAQNNLGNAYCFGQGTGKNEALAVRWYYKAAAQEYAAAMCNLGNCYYDGSGVKKSPEEAAVWYRKAAEKGHAAAQYNLGICCEKGIGVKKDGKEAILWYSKAAEQGYKKAQYSLGYCFEKGIGVKKNKTEAIKWYQRAAEHGDEN